MHVFGPDFKDFYYGMDRYAFVKNEGTVNTSKTTVDGGGTAIGEVQRSISVDVFPNPASGYITIKTEDFSSAAFFEIVDPTGRKLKEGRVNRDGTQVNISTLATGIYLVRVFNAQDQLTVRLMRK
jgi:hypothetical protein